MESFPRRNCTISWWCSLWLLVLSTSFAVAEPMPTAPLAPSMQDCRRLNGEFHSRLSKVFHQISECMTQPPEFGYGPECGMASEQIHTTLTAWKQCSYLQPQQCELLDAQRREVKLCNERASQSDRRDVAALRRISDIEQGMAGSWGKAFRSLTNPTEFFFNTGIGKVTKTAFPAWRGEADLKDDPRAEQLFRFLQGTSEKALRSSANPIVREMQLESLLQIFNHFKRLTKNLNTLTTQINNFRTDGAGVRDAPSPTDNSYQPTQGLCQTLGTCPASPK